MISAETYEWAKKAIQKDTTKLSDEELQTLVDTIDQYDKDSAKGTQGDQARLHGRTAAGQGESRSMFDVGGPQGLDVLERRIGPSPNDADGIAPAPTPMGKGLSTIEDATRLQRATSDISTPIPSLDETKREKDRRKFEYEQARNANYDPKLPSASGQKDLYRPPEFIPQGLDFMGAMPSALGGGVEHYVEPGVSQFQRDMRPVYGDAVDGMGPGSPQFQQYADAQWKAIYEDASAKGKPVVRLDYANHPEWRAQTMGEKNREPGLGSKLAYGAADAIGKLGAGADAFADTATLGLASRAMGNRENAEKLESSNPGSAMAGSALGAMNPYSAGSGMAKGVGKAIGPLADIPVLGAAIKGGSAAGGSVLGEEAVSREFGEKPSADIGDRALEAALLGASIGAGSDLLGLVAAEHGKDLRDENTSTGRDLVRAERIGGQTRFNPLKPAFDEGPNVRDLETRARSGEGETTGIGLASGELADKLAVQGRTTTEAAKNAVDLDNQKYFSLTKNVREPGTELLDDALKFHEQRTNFSGEDLPGRDNRAIRRIIGQLADVSAVKNDAFAVLKNAQAVSPGTIIKNGDEAARYGIDVDNAMRRWARDNGVPLEERGQAAGIAPPTSENMAATGIATPEAQSRGQRPATQELPDPADFKFIVRPKTFNAEKWSDVLDAVDTMGKPGEGKPVDPVYTSFLRTARQVRDRFPEVGPAAGRAYALDDGTVVTGWSALNQEHSDLLQKTRNELSAAGMAKTPGPRPGLRDQQGIQSAVQRYGRSGSDMAKGEAADIEKMASEAGELPTLKGVKGLYAARRLQGQTATKESAGIYGGRPFESFRTNNLRMHLDPILSTLGLPSGERSFEAGIRPDTGNLTNPFRLRGGAPGRGAVALERRKGEPTLSPEEARQLYRIIQGVEP